MTARVLFFSLLCEILNKISHSFPVKEQTYQADDVDKNPRIRDCNFGSSFSISFLKIGEIDTRHEQKLPTDVLLHVED